MNNRRKPLQAMKRWIGRALSCALAAALVSPLSTLAVSTPFTDIPAADWYTDGVGYVYSKNIMTGLNDTQFGPDVTLNRAMAVTILHRMAGSPQSYGSLTFSDTSSDAYYSPSLVWALNRGITTGYSPSSFGPSDSLTREQLASFLYRYHRSLGHEVTARTNLSRFSDAASIGSYAIEPVSWAVARGYIQGSAGKLDPQGGCSRAMAAVIFTRYLQDLDDQNSSQVPEGSVPSVSGRIQAETAYALTKSWTALRNQDDSIFGTMSSAREVPRIIVWAHDYVDLEPYGPRTWIETPEHFYVAQFENMAQAQSARTALSRDVRVDLCILDQNETDPYSHTSWGADSIHASDMQKKLMGTQGSTLVAIIDTGADLSHPQLAGRMVGGYDFSNGDSFAQDDDGHGSHVAGIIADVTRGLNVFILPVKVFNGSDPYSSDTEVARGIDYAVAQGAQVINLSVGIHGHSEVVEAAIRKALANNITVVAASGNNHISSSDFCPAHMREIITVGAVDRDLKSAYYSNYGDEVDLCAPGSNILSSYRDGQYRSMSGTSMAAPFVSAAASLLLYNQPFQSCSTIEQTLRVHTKDLGTPGWDPEYGQGMLMLDF